MKFGLFSLMPVRDQSTSNSKVLHDTFDMVDLAEQAGFETAWFSEHHFSNYSISPSPILMASHVAARTKKIKVGTAVIILPLYNPMRVAQEIAMLDLQSEGRAVIGFGGGYQHYEFERFGVPIADKTERFLEYWDVVEDALRKQHVDYRGKYIEVPDTHFLLAPAQKPFPPFFVATTHPDILDRAVKSGATVFTSGTWLGTEGLLNNRKKIQDALVSKGHAPDALPLAVQQYIHVTDSKAEAREAAEGVRYTARVLAALGQSGATVTNGFIQPKQLVNEPSLETFEKNIIIGDAEYVAERISKDIELLNPVHYSCYFHFGGMESGRAKRSLEKFGSHAMPLIEKYTKKDLKMSA
ncbi:LLM class flavin-dependent oxidoreductase [Phyllobacterium sp. SB3]|uniref:LLM class flavin-dependent oxidoreductase n=1 Tax=Phyllobacterium sp. SB3 TaxID=3156073 RepID=UPI0032AF6658